MKRRSDRIFAIITREMGKGLPDVRIPPHLLTSTHVSEVDSGITNAPRSDDAAVER